MKEYVIKIGIGTSNINGEDYAILMLDHIDLDSLLRTAAIMELIKPTLTPLNSEHPHFFGEQTDVTGVDTELAVSIKRVKKMITLKVESRSTLAELLDKVKDQADIERTQKHLPDTFVQFNYGRKYFSQQATMVYSGVYKNSYRDFIKNYQEKGFYLIILGDDGKPMPGVQLIKNDIDIKPSIAED
ncbi:hypothetical protein V6C27_10155 [Peptococcaceae bacterium 1198_IL3148]